MTRAKVLHAVAADLNALVASGELAGWALCGGFALAVWGAPRATLDIDVLAATGPGRSAAAAASALALNGWVLLEHARHPGDPVPELLRMRCGGVAVDILVAHRAWEAAIIEQAIPVRWKGVDIPCASVEALAAMKLRAGGPQDVVDAARLQEMPDFDRDAFAAWKKKLRVR